MQNTRLGDRKNFEKQCFQERKLDHRMQDRPVVSQSRNRTDHGAVSRSVQLWYHQLRRFGRSFCYADYAVRVEAYSCQGVCAGTG